MKPTKEEEQKFWEGCIPNLKQETFKEPYDLGYSTLWNTATGRLPEIDLNNLFKYAVPKLKGVMGGRRLEEIHLYPSEDGWLCELDMVLMEYSEYTAEKCKVEYERDYPALDPALALFWAIYKVIV